MFTKAVSKTSELLGASAESCITMTVYEFKKIEVS